MAGYVQVAEEEGEETIELPTEEDGTLLLSTLQAQYPGTSGLKYRATESSAARGIRLTEGHLHPPPGNDGWGEAVYVCVFPKENSVAENKRKRDDTLENSTAKTKRIESKLKCTDLIVLGMVTLATKKRQARGGQIQLLLLLLEQVYHGKRPRRASRSISVRLAKY